MVTRIIITLVAAAALAGCGGADPGAGEPTSGRPGGRAQIAGPGGPGDPHGPRIAGGSASLDEAEYQLARHAADIVRIMRDHMDDCDRAERVCDAYIAHNRASIEDAKARITAAIEAGPPERDVEDEIEHELQRLLLEMEPYTKRIAEDFEDRCRGVSDDIGDVFDF